jgi:hypothetical protein
MILPNQPGLAKTSHDASRSGGGCGSAFKTGPAGHIFWSKSSKAEAIGKIVTWPRRITGSCGTALGALGGTTFGAACGTATLAGLVPLDTPTSMTRIQATLPM